MKIGKGRVFKNRRYPNSRTARIIAMVTIAVVIVFAALLQFPFVTTPPAEAQLGSPDFENPPELISRNKKLRATMEIINGTFSVPGLKTEQYRQFRGHYPGSPLVPGTSVSPGPTLRARLGDQVQLAFLNKIDDSQFPYTYVTGKDKPPFSDLGCDQAGLPDPVTGKFPYPANDIYPNCFHGSNTANIHFHGTHTSPDGLGDNVLVQVLSDPKQPDWTSLFNTMYNSGKIPQRWIDLPLAFRKAQIAMVKKRDDADMALAIKNNLRPPESMSDANHEAIMAGDWPQYFIGSFPNFFDIPDYNSGKYKAGQAPGTHWYHAHKHGSTSLHIRNGLAGAFVIESSEEGGYDHFIRKSLGWGATYGDHEKILVLQQFDPTQNLERSPQGGAKGSKQVVVNGQLTPTITMKPGEVQLWRFVNATQGNGEGVITAGTTSSGVFGAKTFKFVQTAQDGVQFSPGNYLGQPYLRGVVSSNGLVLAAGNRADLLVKAPLEPGTVAFKNGTTTVLFYVKVEGSPVTPDQSFPTTWAKMPKFLLDLPVPGPYDIKNPGSPVQFQWEKGRASVGPLSPPQPPAGPHFMINDKQFGESGPIVDQCMPLNGLQDWVLENYTSVVAHPFHIHINPFQVMRIDTPTAQNKYSSYTPTDNYLWQDVIAIPPAIITTNKDGSQQITPGRIVIRQTYLDFTGTYVLHCHILAHEDRGMMQLVRVVPLADYPKGCQANPPQHH